MSLKSKEIRIILGLLACCLLAASPLPAIAATAAPGDLVSYDDFKQKYIDPDKWVGHRWDPNRSERESIREIESSRLHLLVRHYGGTGSDDGLLIAQNFLLFANQNDVTSFKATVRVKAYQQDGCSANAASGSASVRARLRGRFFSSGADPGNGENDIMASVRLSRRMDSTAKSNVFNVEGTLFHCADADCMTGTTLGTAVLGTVKVGQNADLRITWDKSGSRFLYQLNKGGEFELPYDPALDVSQPGRPLKGLDVTSYAPNCQSDSRGIGFIDALFDNVYTNPLD